MSKKVCIYCQAAQESRECINLQIEILKSFAKKNGFENITFFADNGVSGVNLDRKEFQKLLDFIKSGEVSTLIVKNMSRLGRNHIEVGKLIDVILPKYNVRLISVDECIDSEKSEDEFMQIENIINKLYRKNKSRQKNKLFAK